MRNHGGNVNVEDHDGDTPLFAAETVEVAKVLIEELGADAGHRNSSGLVVHGLDIRMGTTSDLLNRQQTPLKKMANSPS